MVAGKRKFEIQAKFHCSNSGLDIPLYSLFVPAKLSNHIPLQFCIPRIVVIFEGILKKFLANLANSIPNSWIKTKVGTPFKQLGLHNRLHIWYSCQPGSQIPVVKPPSVVPEKNNATYKL